MNINELATLSIGTKKDEYEAFITIQKIIEQSDSISGIGIEEYKNLYAFFSKPSRPKKDKWSWMNGFCDKNDYRSFGYVFVKDGYIYATNGHILARSKNDLGLDDGQYDKNGVKISDEPPRVDVNQVFDGFDFTESQLLRDDIKQAPFKNFGKITQGYYFESLDDCHYFDKKLYDRATGYTGLLDKRYYLKGNRLTLVIGEPDLCVAIMPVRYTNK